MSRAPQNQPGALVLDELRRCPGHWHTLSAGGGFAAVRCLDCGFTAAGNYRHVVDRWNAHLPSPRHGNTT